MSIRLCLSFALLFLSPLGSFAQDESSEISNEGARDIASQMGEDSGSDSSEIDSMEAELRKAEVKPRGQKKSAAPTDSTNVETLADLSKLAPFEDVSVIQKRFMPKTERFQFFGGFTTIANDPWFLGMGLNARLAYGFSEAWGIELMGTYLSTSSKDITKDLNNNVNVLTSSLISVKNYVGADIMWTPIYGKMSLFNTRIIPFDMYFSLGGGNSSLSGSTISSAGTVHAGMGQIFSLSKSLGFRWDLGLNSFSAPAGTTTNIFLTLGVNYYVPEVKYR